jgi:thiaminase
MYSVDVKGDNSMQFLLILAVFVPAVWYYADLGKRISAEEKKAGKDLSDEINPFTGAR